MNSKNIILALFFLALAGGIVSAEPTAAGKSEFIQLRNEIYIINLLGNLSLNAEQKNFVLDKAKKAGEERENFRSYLNSANEQIVFLLKKVKSELLQNKLSKETISEYYQLERQLLDADKQHKLAISSLAKEIEEILTPAQRVILAEYTPSIIPPQDPYKISKLRDPNKTAEVENFLVMVRLMPAEVYGTAKQEILRNIHTLMTLHNVPEERINETLDHISQMLDIVRAMEEGEFTAKRRQFAAEITAKIQQIAQPKVNSDKLIRKIEKFLLSPQIIPVLQQTTTP